MKENYHKNNLRANEFGELAMVVGLVERGVGRGRGSEAAGQAGWSWQASLETFVSAYLHITYPTLPGVIALLDKYIRLIIGIVILLGTVETNKTVNNEILSLFCLQQMARS